MTHARAFAALTSSVAVELADDIAPAPRALIDLLLAGYPDTTEPSAFAYQLAAGAMTAVGRHVEPVREPIDLAPLFELDLYQQLAERAAPGWLLHAAALERGGRAFVFAGPSGAGKTSLTLALIARGWRLVTEEMALVDRDLSVRGLARPIHTAADGPERAALPASWPSLEYPLRRADGVEHRAIAQPPRDVRAYGPLPLAAIARIDHAPDRPAQLARLPAHASLPRLWDATLRQDDDGLAAAVAICAARPAWSLESSSVEAAADLADQLASSI